MSIVSESDFYRYWKLVWEKILAFRPMQKQFITSSSKLKSINEMTNTFSQYSIPVFLNMWLKRESERSEKIYCVHYCSLAKSTIILCFYTCDNAELFVQMKAKECLSSFELLNKDFSLTNFKCIQIWIIPENVRCPTIRISYSRAHKGIRETRRCHSLGWKYQDKRIYSVLKGTAELWWTA